MATRLVADLEAITRVLQATTTTLQATKTNPQKWSMMETHITALLECSERISSDLRSLGPNWHSLFKGQSATETVVGRRLQAEHASCMAAYIEYLAVAVMVLRREDAALVERAFTPALISMGASFIERNLKARFGSFLVLWEYTCKSDTLAVFLIHASSSPTAVAALPSAIHSIMSWLLRFLRSGSPALEVMQTQERVTGVWHQGALMLLKIVITLLSTIIEDPGACRALRSLPQGLLTTLCCLVSEMSPPPGMALMKGKGQHIDVIEDTIGFLGFFQAACNSEQPFREVHPELYTTASLEVTKLAILVFSKISTTHPQLIIDYQYMLCSMIDDFMSHGLRHQLPSRSNHNSSSKTAACGSSSSGGIYGTEMSPAYTLSDPLLVSAVHKHSLKHPQGLQQSTNLMGCVVRAWEITESSPQHVACLRVTLRHCAMHAGAWMKGQRKALQQQRQQRFPSPQQQSEMQEMQALFLDSENWWFTKERIARGMRLSPDSSTALSQDTLWLKLDAWQSLPGSSMVMETVLRGAGLTINTKHLCRAVDMFLSKLVTASAHKVTVVTGTADISLVSTLLKLINIHTHPAPASMTETDALHERLTLQQVTGQYISLSYALQMTLDISERVAMAKPRLSRLLHQLSAVLTVGLIRMSIWQLREGGSNTTAGTVPQWIDELSNSAQHVEMANIARQLTVPFSQKKSLLGSEVAFDQLEARLWEGYALEHFDGRLVPGCCHLGCTKLTGVSEAAMPTLLCNGCKRARYCSVACQRAGWVAGGHAKVCCGVKGK